MEIPATDLLGLHAMESVLAEPIRVIAHHLTTQSFDRGRRGLSVCGASRNVGVSMLASNLALALSQQGARTVLIDGNLVAPRLHEVFGLNADVAGLRQLLADGRLDIQEVIQPTFAPDLHVLPAGPRAEPEIDLGAPRLQTLISDVQRQFDVTIIDTPAANLSSDALKLSLGVGCSVIVAKQGASFVSDVEALSRDLRADGVEVLGAVLNRF